MACVYSAVVLKYNFSGIIIATFPIPMLSDFSRLKFSKDTVL